MRIAKWLVGGVVVLLSLLLLLDPGFFARTFGAMIEASDTDDISERQMRMRQLGNLPLIVIRHGREGMWESGPLGDGRYATLSARSALAPAMPIAHASPSINRI